MGDWQYEEGYKPPNKKWTKKLETKNTVRGVQMRSSTERESPFSQDY